MALTVQETLELSIECFYPLITELVNIRRLMVWICKLVKLLLDPFLSSGLTLLSELHVKHPRWILGT